MWKVLLVDDEPKDHALLTMILPPEFRLISCFTGNEALSAIGNEKPDLVLLDLLLPDMNGIEVMRCLGSEPFRPIYFMVTGCSDTNRVVEAVKAGADEYIVKPYNSKNLMQTIRKHLAIRGPHSAPKREAGGETRGYRLIGESAEMRRVKRQILSYAGSDGTVLVTGESGTGKEVVARALHFSSRRAAGPFHAVNCGAVPETLFESEMFGSDRGAFTDATTRPGLFESSDGGTLLLDEIGELAPFLQVKILRVLEEKRVMHLGSYKSFPVDVRIVAATNRDLRESLKDGTFRSDLYYRLNVLRISIPPLRERREDIPILSYAFLKDLRGADESDKYFTAAGLRKMMNYSWPGNVRELRNVISRAYHLCEEEKIGPEYILFE